MSTFNVSLQIRRHLMLLLFASLFSVMFGGRIVTAAPYKPHYLGSFTAGGEVLTGGFNVVGGKAYAFIPFITANDRVIFADGIGHMFNGLSFVLGGGVGTRFLLSNFTQMAGVYAGYRYMRTKEGNMVGYAVLNGEYHYQRIFAQVTGYVPMGQKDFWTIHRSVEDVPQAPQQDGKYYSFYLLRQQNLSYRVDRLYLGGEGRVGYDFPHGISAGIGGYYWTNTGEKFPDAWRDVAATIKRQSEPAGLFLTGNYDVLSDPRAVAFVGRSLPFSRITISGLLGYDSTNGLYVSASITSTLRTYPIPTDPGIYKHMVDPVWTRIPYSHDASVVKGKQVSVYKLNPNTGKKMLFARATTGQELIDMTVDPNISGVIVDGQLKVGSRIKLPNNFTLCGNLCYLTLEGKEYAFPTQSGKGPFFPARIEFTLGTTKADGALPIGKRDQTGFFIGGNDSFYNVAIFMPGSTPENQSAELKTLGEAQAAIFNVAGGDTNNINKLSMKHVIIYGGYVDLEGMTENSWLDLEDVLIVPGKVSGIIDYKTKGPAPANGGLPNNADYPSIMFPGSIFPRISPKHFFPDVLKSVLGTGRLPRGMIKAALNVVQAKGTLHILNMDGLRVGQKMSDHIDASLGQKHFTYNDMGGIFLKGEMVLERDVSLGTIVSNRSSSIGSLNEDDDKGATDAKRKANAQTTDNGSLYYACVVCLVGTGAASTHTLTVSGNLYGLGQNTFGIYFEGENKSAKSDGFLLYVLGSVQTSEYGSPAIYQNDGETYGLLVDGGLSTNGVNASGIMVQEGGTLKNFDIEGGILTQHESSPGLDIYGTLDSGVLHSGIRAMSGSDAIRNNKDGVINKVVVFDVLMAVGTVYTGTDVASNGGFPTKSGGGAHTHGGATPDVWVPSQYELRNPRYQVKVDDGPNYNAATGYRIRGWYLSADGVHLSQGSKTSGLIVVGILGYPYTVLVTGFPFYVEDLTDTGITPTTVKLNAHGDTYTAGVAFISPNSGTGVAYVRGQLLGGRATSAWKNFTYVKQAGVTDIDHKTWPSNTPIPRGPIVGNGEAKAVSYDDLGKEDGLKDVCYKDNGKDRDGKGGGLRGSCS